MISFNNLAIESPGLFVYPEKEIHGKIMEKHGNVVWVIFRKSTEKHGNVRK
jgi:hypothetical protein